jgi:hypothetical protein
MAKKIYTSIITTTIIIIIEESRGRMVSDPASNPEKLGSKARSGDRLF